MRLVFDAPAHHVLVVGGERIQGGGEFTVDDDYGLELLTQPGMTVSQVSEAKEADKPSRRARARTESNIEREADTGEAQSTTDEGESDDC